MKIIFCGVDLAAKEKNPTGISFIDLNNNVLKEFIVFKDEEIINHIKKFKPKIIAIDAPLSLPKKGNMREEEKKIRKIGYKIFPFFKSMRELAKRAIKLKKKLKGYKVIEVFPSVSSKILNIKREKNKRKSHIVDARIAAITAKMLYENKCIKISGRFYIPKIESIKII